MNFPTQTFSVIIFALFFDGICLYAFKYPMINIPSTLPYKSNNKPWILTFDKDSIELTCTSNHSVDWKYDGVGILSDSIQSTSSLWYLEKRPGTGLLFQNRLIVKSSLDTIGRYTCFETENTENKIGIYVFFEEKYVASEFFLPKDRPEIQNVDYNELSEYVTFPCPASSADLIPTLIFEGLIVPAPLYKYDPTVGFSINLDRTGTRNCSGLFTARSKLDEVKFFMNYSPLINAEPKETYIIVNNTIQPIEFMCNATENITMIIGSPVKDATKSSLSAHCNFYDSAPANHVNIHTCRLSSALLGEPYGEVSCISLVSETKLHTWTYQYQDNLVVEIGLERLLECKSPLPTELLFVGCHTLTECNLRKSCLNKNCTGLQWHGPHSKGGAYYTRPTYGDFNWRAGIFKCSNDYGEITQTFLHGVTRKGNNLFSLRIYINLTEALLNDDTIQVGRSDSPKSTIYRGIEEMSPPQLYSFEILLLNFGQSTHFSHPNTSAQFSTVVVLCQLLYTRLRRFIQLKNRTKITVSEENIRNEWNGPSRTESGLFEHRVEIHLYRTDITRIVCKNYFANSTLGFWEKFHDIEVLESTAPEILNQIGHYEFYQEDTTVVPCMASGDPLPEISWISGNNETLNSSKVWTGPTETNSLSERSRNLNFEKEDVSSKVSAIYVCVTSNPAGEVRKSFQVSFYPGHRYSAGYYAQIVVPPIVIVGLLAVIIGLAYYVRKNKEKFRNLNDEELAEFDKGIEMTESSPDSFQNPYGLPYNRAYEIPRAAFTIDERKTGLLGKGAFGSVYRGKCIQENEILNVAIKTIKFSIEIIYFKALLSELKLMIHIGKFPNIVAVIGACTSEIQSRNLFVVLEFCENGNLLNFLEKQRSVFRDMIRNNRIQPIHLPDETNSGSASISSKELLRFCLEITSALQYLRHRKVLHGDIAARNILLDAQLTAKLADFGLASD